MVLPRCEGESSFKKASFSFPELSEEWTSGAKEPVQEGVTFYLKYLGSTFVENAKVSRYFVSDPSRSHLD